MEVQEKAVPLRPGDLEHLQKKWPQLVQKIGEKHPVIRTDLLDSWPERLTDTTCSIGFDPEFAGEINEVKRLGYDLVHRAVVAELNRPIRVEFVKAAAPIRWSHQLKHPVPAHTVPSTNLRSWENNPAIRQVLEIFHGDVRDVQK